MSPHPSIIEIFIESLTVGGDYVIFLKIGGYMGKILTIVRLIFVAIILWPGLLILAIYLGQGLGNPTTSEEKQSVGYWMVFWSGITWILILLALNS
jgi:hypothetical protein